MMKSRAMLVLAAAINVGVLACSDTESSEPTSPSNESPKVPAGFIVSNPHASFQINLSTGAKGSEPGPNVVYISSRPGTFDKATSAVFTNVTRAAPEQAAELVMGGFDPVAVQAEAGDKIVVTTHAFGSPLTAFTVLVPNRHSPILVRTTPAQTMTDVPLHAQIKVVFSEPVDPATVNLSSVTLFAGDAQVAGKLQLASNGCEAELIPDSPLASHTDYSLEISTGVHDLDGDPLDERTEIHFKTADVSLSQLVFSRNGQIYTIAADGTGLAQLTANGNNFSPAFSPDGRRIAFARNVRDPANNGFGYSDIYTMAPDGSDFQRLTVNAFFNSAAWSPDGKKLAVSEEGVYEGSIFVISAVNDGNPPAFLVDDARTPAWSPDGKQIAYVHLSHDDGYHQVYVMNADGTDSHPITDQDAGGIFGLSWSPDGSKLAFSKCLNMCVLYTIDRSGGLPTPVVDLPGAGGAAWSRDGKWIAFEMGRWPSTSIAYVPAAGGPIREVTPGAGPSWGP